jgi:hypothetical protein
MLVKALVRAHRWRRRIESGKAKSITDLAEQEGVTDAYVCRLLSPTCLAPDILTAARPLVTVTETNRRPERMGMRGAYASGASRDITERRP